jgi:hypothetical protein
MEPNPYPVLAEYQTALQALQDARLCSREWSVTVLAREPAYEDLRARLRTEQAARRNA